MRRTFFPAVCRRVLRVGSLVFAIAGAGVSEAEAARLRSTWNVANASRPVPTVDIPLRAFLRAGPALWSRANPQLPSGLRLARNSDGTLKESLFLDYLQYRRSLNPGRFDLYHPRVAYLLSLNPTLPVVDIPSPLIPPIPLRPPAQQQVPEPAAIVVFGLILAAIAVRPRRGAV